jgi:eukaryotic-like serine/threonine-protein kinase
MSFEVGQFAGGYEFVDVQGKTETGQGFWVRNVLAERMEVLRVLPKEPQLGREDVDRLLSEIKAHARLSHPNIVSFYDATEIDSELVMTSELFDGITLEQRLCTQQMPLPETIVCMSQVLSALHYAHELGIVHRGVSPANILLGSDGTVKLTGFGLPAAASVYISPEQANGAADLDARSDIYSAGAVLYEMVTGRPPLRPEPPPGAAPILSHIVLTALAKDPTERFQSARQFRDALESLAETEAEWAPEAPPAAGEQAWGLQKLALIGVVTFVAILSLILLFLKTGRT